MARVALPTPGSVVPIQYSAAPKAVSPVTGAVSTRLVAPFVGLGDAERLVSVGACRSTTRSAALTAPQLPAASWART